jgi:hypothetical protein
MIAGLLTTSFLLFWLVTVLLLVIVVARFSRRRELERLTKWRFFSGASSSEQMFEAANSRDLIFFEEARGYLASGIGKAHGMVWGALLLATIGLGLSFAALKM